MRCISFVSAFTLELIPIFSSYNQIQALGSFDAFSMQEALRDVLLCRSFRGGSSVMSAARNGIVAYAGTFFRT
jgi:hypothetical protein